MRLTRHRPRCALAASPSPAHADVERASVPCLWCEPWPRHGSWLTGAPSTSGMPPSDDGPSTPPPSDDDVVDEAGDASR